VELPPQLYLHSLHIREQVFALMLLCKRIHEQEFAFTDSHLAVQLVWLVMLLQGWVQALGVAELVECCLGEALVAPAVFPGDPTWAVALLLEVDLQKHIRESENLYANS
jgi:hypothetical protein